MALCIKLNKSVFKKMKNDKLTQEVQEIMSFIIIHSKNI